MVYISYNLCISCYTLRYLCKNLILEKILALRESETESEFTLIASLLESNHVATLANSKRII